MKEWKVRQHVFHRTTPPTDMIEKKPVIICDEAGMVLVNRIVLYFSEQSGPELLYPSKAYAVAIVYAHLLAKYFDEDVISCLSDPDLLFGNDAHFVPYAQDPKTYDCVLQVLRELELCDFESSTFTQVQATVECFREEFMLS